MATIRKKSRAHALLSGTGLFLLATTVAAIILHFSWNMTMPELFGANEMSVKNAVGLVFLLAVVLSVFSRVIFRRHVRMPRGVKAERNEA